LHRLEKVSGNHGFKKVAKIEGLRGKNVYDVVDNGRRQQVIVVRSEVKDRLPPGRLLPDCSKNKLPGKRFGLSAVRQRP
jgi:hypothetical protein